MEATTLETIARWCNGDLSGPGSLTVAAVSIDSRNVPANALFVAIKGEQHDGHNFVPQALAGGVGCVLVSRAWLSANADLLPVNTPCIAADDTTRALQDMARGYRQARNVRVVAVTGSNGKTTTKNMIAALLATAHPVHKTEGNKNNYIGLPLTLLNLTDAHRFAVIEMGMSFPGEIDLLARIADPDYGVITNVNPAHLEVLKNVENVAQAKLELFRAMRPEGLGFLNADDELLMRHRPGLTLRTKTFGQDHPADVRATVVTKLPEGGYDVTAVPGLHFKLPLLGRFNITNALAACAVALECGIAPDHIAPALATCKPEKMRLERVAAGKVEVLSDCYNANPASVKAALAVLAEEPCVGRRVAVLGDMRELGENSSQFHYQVGQQLAAHGIDLLVAFGDQAKFYVGGAMKEGVDKERLFYSADKTQVAAHLRSLLHPGDLVLLKGSRRMKMEDFLTQLREG